VDYTQKSISERIKQRVEEKFHLLMDKLSTNLAYDFLFSPSYDVIHTDDPPWDCSGSLVQLDEKLTMREYTCVGDFFEAYNGQSTASYVSGCGVFHTKYESKYEQLIQEYIFDCYREVLCEIDDRHLVEILLTYGFVDALKDKDEIIQSITDIEVFEEPFWFHFDKIERIKPISFEWMVLRGKDKATEQYNNKLKIYKERQDRLNYEKEAAEKLWNKLQIAIKLKTGSYFSKIEMKDYETFKQFLADHQVSNEER